jgi:hypothetical protein
VKCKGVLFQFADAVGGSWHGIPILRSCTIAGLTAHILFDSYD